MNLLPPENDKHGTEEEKERLVPSHCSPKLETPVVSIITSYSVDTTMSAS